MEKIEGSHFHLLDVHLEISHYEASLPHPL